MNLALIEFLIALAIGGGLLAGGWKLGSDHEIASQAKAQKQVQDAVEAANTASAEAIAKLRPFDSQKLNQNLPFAADQGAHKNTSISDSLLGTFRSIFQNAIEGVSIGFVLYLELVGVGYKAIIHSAKSSEDSLRQPSQFAGMVQPSQLAGMVQPSQFAGMVHEERAKNQIEFKLGQSHDIYFQLPSSIKAFAIKPTLIGLYSIDKAELNQIAAEIRSIRPPEPYKGKGIRFKDEVIKNKVGKKK